MENTFDGELYSSTHLMVKQHRLDSTKIINPEEDFFFFTFECVTSIVRDKSRLLRMCEV